MKSIISAIALAFAVVAAPSFAASHAASAPMGDKKPTAAPAAAPASAAEKKPTAQQEKMASCNKNAGDQKGDERKAFMSECLSTKPAVAASPACEKSAADKKLAGAAKTSHINKCMADASAKK